MSMYNLIEYSVNKSKTLRNLCRYYRDETALANGGITDFLLIIMIVFCLSLHKN